MRNFRVILLIILSLAGIISSCASLKSSTIQNEVQIINVKEIEGKYANISVNKPEYSYNQLKELIDHTQKIKNTDTIISVDLKIVDNKRIQFTFLDYKQNKYSYFSRYRLKGGTVILKNKVFRLTGIPYLFGGYKLNKTELYLTDDKNLIIRSLQKEDGAFLFVIPGSLPKSNFENIYSRN